MLKRIKYESIEFSNYLKLRKLFLGSQEDPNEIEMIDLSRQFAIDFPPAKALEEMPKLIELNLSNNRINRFQARILTQYSQRLEILILTHNQIDLVDDLSDLGSLQHLKILEFQHNPICDYMKHIVLLQELLFPRKYQKYDPVKILTAEHNIPANPKLTKEEEIILRENIVVNSMLPQELELENNHQLVSKYSHKNTIAKYSVELCPVPRKSRFPNLIRVNGERITKFDVMRVSGKKNISEIV